ncbi:MAG TPA: PKD domain-containing protein [Thermoplasmata archaeon]|nr:PKD domain-containing protein [Thermoplasmata archaeon]
MDSRGRTPIAIALLIVTLLLGSGLGAFSVAGANAVTPPRLAGHSNAVAVPGSDVLSRAISSLASGAGPAHGAPALCSTQGSDGARCGLGAPSVGQITRLAPAASAPASPRGAPTPASHPQVAYPAISWSNVTGRIGYYGSPTTYYGAMAYDPLLNRVLLVSGCTTYACPSNEIWEYPGFDWVNLTGTFSSAPSARYGPMMDFDPLLGGIVLFGGDNGVAALNDTWLYTGTWTNITNREGFAPTNAFGSLAWDPALSEMILVDGCSSHGCASVWSGTWALGNSGWTVLGAGPDNFLAYASMAFDPVDGYLLHFGGYDLAGPVNWTYTYSAGTWTNITTHDAGCFLILCFTPPARDFAAMTWDQQQGVIFMTGGYNSTAFAFYNDSWLFLHGIWFPADFFNAAPPNAYPPVFGMALAVNSTGINPFMVGGYCPTANCYGNDWVWENPPAFANVTVGPNPTDDNAAVWVNATSAGGYGSGPQTILQVGWGNGWLTDGYTYGVNATGNWTRDVYYYYGTNSPAGSYAATVQPFDWFFVGGPFWNFTITVNANLTVGMNPTPPKVEVGSSVAFGASATAGTTPYRFNWTFGDGGSATGATAAHAFTRAGSFDVNVTVTDAGGGTNTTNATIVVLPALTAAGSASMATVDLGVAVTLTGSASAGSGTYTGYNWSFGDGTTSHTATASHVYATTGTYHASFNVTDSLGYKAYHNLTIVVNGALAASPTATPASTVTGTTVNFTAGAASGSAPYTYSWAFGDGARSSSATPSHKYTAAGTFMVTLWVNDSGGGSVTKTLTVAVTPPPVSNPAGSSALGLPLWIWIVLLVVVIAAVLGAVFAMRRRKAPPAAAVSSPPPGVNPPPSPPASGGPPPGAMG